MQHGVLFVCDGREPLSVLNQCEKVCMAMMSKYLILSDNQRLWPPAVLACLATATAVVAEQSMRCQARAAAKWRCNTLSHAHPYPNQTHIADLACFLLAAKPWPSQSYALCLCL